VANNEGINNVPLPDPPKQRGTLTAPFHRHDTKKAGASSKGSPGFAGESMSSSVENLWLYHWN
jgi:hypothetical protein